MLSLKRSRSGDDSTPWERQPPRKRLLMNVTPDSSLPCASSPTSREILFQESNINLNSIGVARCLHKLAIPCGLADRSRCCACADDRLACPDYLAIVPSNGRTTTGKRWHAYCCACKVYWEEQCFAGTILQAPLAMAYPWLIFVHIESRSFDNTVKVIPSVDFNLPDLAIALSRALHIHPQEISWKESGGHRVYSGAKSAWQGKDRGSVHHIRCRVQLSEHRAHEPEPMEGVQCDTDLSCCPWFQKL